MGQQPCRAFAQEAGRRIGLKEGDDVDVTSADAQTVVISKSDDKGDFLARLRSLQKPKPAGFVWNRDDANTR